VMAPMIATPDEAKNFADAARAYGLTPGVMIEVPAAALLAERILDHVDFLSIGTNDLAQYTMAADRMSADLATLTDPWQPGVLALVSMTAKAGAAVGKPVGVCGEAAADPLLACVLIGLGITWWHR
jgi:phosphoenolpyruvate-protein phosphotransferase (PTS system enzyme I)